MSALSSASKFSPYGPPIIPCRSKFHVCYRLCHPGGLPSLSVCAVLISLAKLFTRAVQTWAMWALVYATMQNSESATEPVITEMLTWSSLTAGIVDVIRRFRPVLHSGRWGSATYDPAEQCNQCRCLQAAAMYLSHLTDWNFIVFCWANFIMYQLWRWSKILHVPGCRDFVFWETLVKSMLLLREPLLHSSMTRVGPQWNTQPIIDLLSWYFFTFALTYARGCLQCSMMFHVSSIVRFFCYIANHACMLSFM